MKDFLTPTRARKVHFKNGDTIENCTFYILGGFVVVINSNEIYNAEEVRKIELRDCIESESDKKGSSTLYDESMIESEGEILSRIESV